MLAGGLRRIDGSWTKGVRGYAQERNLEIITMKETETEFSFTYKFKDEQDFELMVADAIHKWVSQVPYLVRFHNSRKE